MTWSERFKLTFNTFKNIAFPLYFFYLVFLLLFGGITSLYFFLPLGKRFLQFLEYLDQYEYEFDSFTQTTAAISGSDIFGGDLFFSYLPVFFFSVVLLVGIGLIMTSLLYTGIFNLAVVGHKGKALFRDFKLTGAGRMIGWNSCILLLLLLLISAGIVIFAILSIFSETVSFVFAIIYLVCLVLVSIFLVPWILTGGYYLLAHREWSFGKALINSWAFFSQNMRAFWGAVLVMLLLNIVIALIQEISSSVGGIFSFMATPFFNLIIIVWTITVMNEVDTIGSLETEDTNIVAAYDDKSPYHLPAGDNTPPLTDDNSSYQKSTSFTLDKPNEEDSPLGYYYTPNKSQPQKAIGTEANFCPFCGINVKSNAVYCSKCGVKIR